MASVVTKALGLFDVQGAKANVRYVSETGGVSRGGRKDFNQDT